MRFWIIAAVVVFAPVPAFAQAAGGDVPEGTAAGVELLENVAKAVAELEVLDRACSKVRLDWVALLQKERERTALGLDGLTVRVQQIVDEQVRRGLPEELKACVQLGEEGVPLINE